METNIPNKRNMAGGWPVSYLQSDNEFHISHQKYVSSNLTKLIADNKKKSLTEDFWQTLLCVICHALERVDANTVHPLMTLMENSALA